MTCQQASEIVSRELDTELSIFSRMGLAVHTFFCGSCRRHRRHMAAVDSAIAKVLEHDSGVGREMTLRPEVRSALQARLNRELNEKT